MLGTWALSGLVTSIFEFWEILNYFNDEGFFFPLSVLSFCTSAICILDFIIFHLFLSF